MVFTHDLMHQEVSPGVGWPMGSHTMSPTCRPPYMEIPYRTGCEQLASTILYIYVSSNMGAPEPLQLSTAIHPLQLYSYT
eukprot:3604480-Prymnesium_polylepis.1